MKNFGKLSRIAAMLAALFCAGGRDELKAQTSPATPVVGGPANVEELSQPELVKAYRQLREQLHATQLALANSRAEADAAARTQAAAFADRLTTLKTSVDAERERQQAEIARSNAERDSQQADMQHLTRTVLWVAAVFGGVGLVVMLLTPVFQWRAVNCMAELAAQRPAVNPPYGLLAAEPAAPVDNAVALSNQRLTSVMERMERRIQDMEHTASSSLTGAGPKASAVTSVSVSPPRNERHGGAGLPTRES